jgi:transposase
VVTTTRHYKGRVYHSHLLRRSYREGGKVKKETVANLTRLGDEIVGLIRSALGGTRLAAADKVFEVVQSRHHGHVAAVLEAMKRLGFERLLASRSSRERDLVQAMVAARILEPESKLATTRSWHTTTLPEVLGVADADEQDLYGAMDWLLERQGRIEKKLAARHLKAGGLVLYDLTSSYFEGGTCPLAAFGHNRDGKKGKLQVNYGLLTDDEGRPVAVSVFEGNTADPKTLLPQVEKVRDAFKIAEMVLVGDRGMISQKQIEEIKERPGVEWITALRSAAIKKLVEGETIQLGLFDERNLFEFTHPDYPGERLVACRNPELARSRAHKRQALMEATARELEKVSAMAARGRLKGRDKIGLRVGKIIDKHKMAKHFHLEIADDALDWRIEEEKVAAEAALDGIYVIRTSVTAERMSAEETVRGYKNLSRVEAAFRFLKSIDLQVRPIRHRLANRVRAHILLCMLAYYVKWHMLAAWRPLLFADEEQHAKETRHPVAAARRSDSALRKVHNKTLADGSEVHSFSTLLAGLATIVRNTCRRKEAEDGEATFCLDTIPSPQQRRAMELLNTLAR